MSDLRIGLGIDAHAFADGVPLMLGGVRFRSPRGLAGHSDGDVITHALIDALLGAVALGDIGSMFPSADERWTDASSIDLLRRAYDEVKGCGYELVNADCVLIGEEPRIAGLHKEMEFLLGGALELGTHQQISVRATTTDRLGFTGRGEGLAAHAVALLRRQ